MRRAFKLLNFFVYDEFPARRDISILSKSSSHVQTKSASNDCMHVNEIFFLINFGKTKQTTFFQSLNP